VKTRVKIRSKIVGKDCGLGIKMDNNNETV
jgi:hypothetical protein